MFDNTIADLDLEPIIVKTLDREEGMGWHIVFAKRVSEEYRKYLTLCLENPDRAVVPSGSVDDFWHYHILDTLKYHEDCDVIFGSYLHHFPYFGMRGPEDEANLKRAWESSLELYKSRFGSPPADIWNESKRCPNCGRRCRATDKFYSAERPRLPLEHR